MKDKTKADQFIREHIRQYGLVGTNVTMNPSKGFVQVPARTPSFTWNNHFVYGYNGSTFNCRDSSSCMYFTDYINAANRDTHIYDELEYTAKQMANVYGRFGIKISGLPIQYALADACRRVGADFFQVVTQHEWADEPLYPYDGRNPTVMVSVADGALKEMVPEVVEVTRSTCSGTLVRALLTRHFENPIVWGGSLRLKNLHHDGDQSVGPEHWVLEDSESETAACRWMMYEGKMGCHNTAIWSPDLMRAQLQACMPFFANESGRNDMAWVDYYFFKIWEAPVTLTRDVPQEFYEWQNVVESWMKEVHDGGKHDEKWLTPIPTLLRSLGVHAPFNMGIDLEEIYGAVL